MKLIPQRIYFAIAALALYGDLLKRALGPTFALIGAYGLFCFGILVYRLRSRKFNRFALPPDSAFSSLCLVLIVVYLAQLLTNWDAPLFEATASALYIVLPLTYIVVIARDHEQFDLGGLAQAFLLLMPPLTVVAVIQYFVDPGFLVDTSYSESGGVIVRNFLGEDDAGVLGTFQRFPSLFASADRFSSMALMQLYFSVLLFALPVKRERAKRMWTLWILVNCGCAASALLISGARSRLVIVGIAMGLACLLLAKQTVTRRTMQGPSIGLRGAASAVILVTIIGWAISFGLEFGGDMKSSIPIIAMIEQTLEKGDLQTRFQEAIAISSMPDGVTIFGKGLGTAGAGGRPGEFAIRAMWEESGVFWTLIMLSIYGALILQLFIHTLAMYRLRLPSHLFLSVVPLLVWFSAVLTGLQAGFELSTALVLFPVIAVASVRSKKPQGLRDRSRGAVYSGPTEG